MRGSEENQPNYSRPNSDALSGISTKSGVATRGNTLNRQANNHQISGTHYKQEDGGEEHWDRVWRLYGRGYFVGCITKYVERYHLKNGIEDLEKARHFLDKLIELETTAKHEAEEL